MCSAPYSHYIWDILKGVWGIRTQRRLLFEKFLLKNRGAFVYIEDKDSFIVTT